MEFRILGPLEVFDASGPVALGRLKERVVLAVLLLHANEVVSRERLIDELWGESPPPTARKAVNVYVSELRKRLAVNGEGPIATVPGGYRLDVDPERLDVACMQHLVATARDAVAAGESGAAAELYRQALGLWRGRTLAGLELESVGRHEIEQLEELRLAALMDRIDCDLALGRHEQLIGELKLLVSEYPLRERLRAQQILALYRADRQAEALEAYGEARRTLVDELGIEPSPALQRLQKGVLAHDPALEIPTGIGARNGSTLRPAPTPVPPPAPKTRFHPRRRHVIVASLASLALAGGLTAFATRASGNRALAPRIQPNSLVRLDPRSGKVVSDVRVGLNPGPIAVTPSAIWTANDGDGTVSRYDLRTRTVQTRGGFPDNPGDVNINLAGDAEGNVWVSGETPVVTRLAGAAAAGLLHRSKRETIRVPGPAVGYLAVGAGYLWTTVGPYTDPGEDDRLSVIIPPGEQVVDSVQLGRATTALAYGDGAAWVGTFINEPKDQVGPVTGSSWLYVIRAGGEPAQPYLDRHPLRRLLETGDTWGPVSIAVGEGAVWVVTCGICTVGGEVQTLLKVDPGTLQVLKRIPLDRGSVRPLVETPFVAAGAGSVWVTSPDGSGVTQLDPSTGHILRAIHLGKENTCGIAATNDAVWVAISPGCA